MPSETLKPSAVMPNALLLSLLLLSVSCSGPKKAARADHARTEETTGVHTLLTGQSRQRQSETERAADTWSEQLRGALEAAADERLEVELRLYDTARPADTLTGRPPRLADVRLRRDRQAQVQRTRQNARQGASARETVRENERTDSLHSRRDEHGERVSETRTQESSKTARRTPWWVCAGLAAVLAALTLRLLRKFRKRP